MLRNICPTQNELHLILWMFSFVFILACFGLTCFVIVVLLSDQNIIFERILNKKEAKVNFKKAIQFQTDFNF